MTQNRNVVHYSGVIEPIDFITKNNLGFCEGNIIKYVYRHADKGGACDMIKIIDYARLIAKQKYPEAYKKICSEVSELFNNELE